MLRQGAQHERGVSQHERGVSQHERGVSRDGHCLVCLLLMGTLPLGVGGGVTRGSGWCGSLPASPWQGTSRPPTPLRVLCSELGL